MLGTVLVEDVRSGGRIRGGRRGVVERRGERVRGVAAGGVLTGGAAQILQALQLLQLHPSAQHLCTYVIRYNYTCFYISVCFVISEY